MQESETANYWTMTHFLYLNPISPGGMVDSNPLMEILNSSNFRFITIPQYRFTFPNYILTWFRNKKKFKKLRGYPHQAPSKILRFKKNIDFKIFKN